MFGMYYHLLVFYQVSLNYVPLAKNGHFPGLTKKSSTLKPLSLDLSYWVCSITLWSSTICDMTSFLTWLMPPKPGERFEAILASCFNLLKTITVVTEIAEVHADLARIFFKCVIPLLSWDASRNLYLPNSNYGIVQNIYRISPFPLQYEIFFSIFVIFLYNFGFFQWANRGEQDQRAL